MQELEKAVDEALIAKAHFFLCWLQIVGETNFVVDIKEWQENRMRGLRRLHNAQKQN